MGEFETDNGQPQGDMQQSYADDFFSDRNGLIDDNTGEVVGGMGQQAPAPNVPAAAAPVAPQAPAAPAAPPAGTAPQTPAAPKPPTFADQFYREENGQKLFDSDKFLSFSKLDQNAWRSQPSPAAQQAPAGAPGQQQAPGAPQQPELPPWKAEIQKQLEERRAYEQNLRQNMTLGITRAQAYLQRTGDAAGALQMAQRDIEKMVGDHLNDYDLETRYKEKETIREREAREREEATLGPESVRIQSHVARELGGMETFNQLVFNPEYGGPIVEWLFDQQNPDAAKMNAQDAAKKMVSWWTRFSSNEANVRRVVDLSKAMFYLKSQPALIEATRAQAIAARTQSQQMQTRAPGGNPTGRRQQGQEPDRVTRWLNSAPGETFDTV